MDKWIVTWNLGVCDSFIHGRSLRKFGPLIHVLLYVVLYVLRQEELNVLYVAVLYRVWQRSCHMKIAVERRARKT